MNFTKINIPSIWVKKLADEFEVAENTVRISLRYMLNSTTGIEIRRKAFEMLEKEAQKPLIVEFED